MSVMRDYSWYACQPINDLREMVELCARKYKKRTAFRFADPDGTEQSVSFTRFRDDVAALGTALWNLKTAGMHFAIIGENSYEWIVSYLAVINGLGVIVPIDKELTDPEIENVITRCDAGVVIYSGTFAPVMRAAAGRLPNVKHFIELGGVAGPDCYSALIRKGRGLLAAGERSYLDAEIDREKMSVIIYTSGTTGISKGVMLSHKNITAVIKGAQCAVKPKKMVLSVLPVNHTYECSCDILAMLSAGVTVSICKSLKYLPQDLRYYKPPLITLVPLIVETFYKRITEEIKKSGRQEKFSRAVEISNALLRFHIDLRRLFFRQVRKALGGKLRLIICGGAPLREDLVVWFREIGVQILNGYGITECAPLVAVNRNGYYCDNSVGVVLPCCEVSIESPDENGEGEVLVHGDNVMLGYYKDEEQTAAALSNGWFRTGDIGKVSGKFLQITGRKKNTIILSNGKNVQPEEIEERLTAWIPYIKEVLVYASSQRSQDRQIEFITAIIVPDMDYVVRHGITDLERTLEKDIRSVNRQLPAFKQVNSVRLQATDFEKTSTKKIKRFKVIEEM